MCEPTVHELAWRFLNAIPPKPPKKVAVDNRQTSAWMRPAPGIDNLVAITERDGHFD